MQFLLSLLTFLSFLHGKNPVTWTSESVKINANEYNLVFTANIEDGWNIYSQYLKNDDGPVKTSITYDNKAGFELVGKNEETGEIKKIMDEMLGMEVIKIKHKGIFTQRIKVINLTKPISGNIEFMCCNDQQCLPPRQIPFSIDLKPAN
jgi:Disulphide bond corrector protein DsbC